MVGCRGRSRGKEWGGQAVYPYHDLCVAVPTTKRDGVFFWRAAVRYTAQLVVTRVHG